MTLGTPDHQHAHSSQTANLMGATAAGCGFRSQKSGVVHVAFSVHIYEVPEGIAYRRSGPASHHRVRRTAAAGWKADSRR